MSLGERITALRKKKNISQGQLAKALDVSRQAISKWENGLSSPDTVKLIQLAELLETEVEYLATGRQPAPPSPAVVTVKQVEERVVEVERVVEKPIIVTQRVEVEKIVEKPVIRKVYRTRCRREPMEYMLVGIGCFLLGILVGIIL